MQLEKRWKRERERENGVCIVNTDFWKPYKVRVYVVKLICVYKAIHLQKSFDFQCLCVINSGCVDLFRVYIYIGVRCCLVHVYSSGFAYYRSCIFRKTNQKTSLLYKICEICMYIYIWENLAMFIPTDCVRIVSFRGIQMYNKQSKAIFCFFWKNFGFICPQRIRQVSVYVSTIFFFFQKHISVAELNINIVTGRFTFFLSFFLSLLMYIVHNLRMNIYM